MQKDIRIIGAQEVSEGDGVTVKRLMPVHSMRNFDPFVLWDHFDIAGGGFPDHPHRGFEAITYLFSGGMRHTDNLGNKGTVHTGGAQRFTAGLGIVHSEFPDRHAAGIQLWINLPGRLKGIDPSYQQIEDAGLPEINIEGGRIRTIVGEGSPLKLHTEVEYLDVRLKPGASFRRDVSKNFRGLVYVVKGLAVIAGQEASEGDACYIDGVDVISIVASEASHLMWCFGAPHGEPIVQHGPFVD